MFASSNQGLLWCLNVSWLLWVNEQVKTRFFVYWSFRKGIDAPAINTTAIVKHNFLNYRCISQASLVLERPKTVEIIVRPSEKTRYFLVEISATLNGFTFCLWWHSLGEMGWLHVTFMSHLSHESWANGSVYNFSIWGSFRWGLAWDCHSFFTRKESHDICHPSTAFLLFA